MSIKNFDSILNPSKSRQTAIITLVLSILAILVALEGLINKNIYEDAISTGVFLETFRAGTLAQDLISVVSGVLLSILSILMIRKPNHKTFIVILGLIGYFLYGYGLFAVSGLYTSRYVLYMIIFILSMYSLILGLNSYNSSIVKKYVLSKGLRMTIGIFLFIIVMMFVPLWLSTLIPHSIENTLPDFYGVFIMDLCLVMPAFAVIALQLLRKKSFGNVLAGVALMKILTLCLSLVIGESLALKFGMEVNFPMIIIYGVLTIISLVLGGLYLSKYKMEVNHEYNNS